MDKIKMERLGLFHQSKGINIIFIIIVIVNTW